MTILRKTKKNLLTVIVAAAYIALLIIKPAFGVLSLKNSVYFVKEMILIMPVIFVLTALLDLWVPKDKIVKLLGKESKIKGVVLSVILGSISAGPIYAAFPLCVMLQKKGASIRNLIIILSAWSVIKVPMLLNEMKFLGLKFMAIRWALTLISIIVFSWLASLIIKDRDLPNTNTKTEKLEINTAACMGCALCARLYPELFEVHGGKASMKAYETDLDHQKLSKACNGCPVKAIIWNKPE